MMSGDLMKTDLECVSPKTTVAQAATRMKQANIGFLPVCDEGTRRVLGTLTDRDIVVRVVAAGESLQQPMERFFTRRVVGVRSTDTRRMFRSSWHKKRCHAFSVSAARM